MATDNEYLVLKLKEHRNGLRRRGQVQQALGISSVLKAVKKFPLPIISVKVAELIQGVGKSYAELIGKWLADKPQKRRSIEDSGAVKCPKLTYPPGSPISVTLLCCLRADSPFQISNVQDAFADVACEFIGEYPKDTASELQKLLSLGDIEVCEGGYRLTDAGMRRATDLANGSGRVSTSSTQCEEIPDPDLWFADLPNIDAKQGISSGQPFEITLYVDTAERLTDNFEYFATQLQNRGVTVEKQKLWIGDYHWVVRHMETIYSLGIIVERKAASDLAASIMDGRYQAQKRRIKEADVQCIYLLEGSSPSKFQMISQDSLLNAVVNTMLKYDFQVKITRNVHETVNWLGRVTLELEKTARSFTAENWRRMRSFEEFQDETNSARTATVQSIFGRQLRSFPACGSQATEAVVRRFCTSKILYDELSQCKSLRARKKLLKSVVLEAGQKLQKRVVEAIIELFTTEFIS